jgi:hypothetical protein
MKIDDLILYLTQLKTKHGSVDCFIYSPTNNPNYIEFVEYLERAIHPESDTYVPEYRPTDGVYRGVFIE